MRPPMVTARRLGVGERRRVDARPRQIGLDRLEQILGRIIGDDAGVHRHQVGRIARGDLRGELRIAGPGDDVDC